MLFQIQDILSPLANFAAFFLLLIGVMWIVYAIYEGSRRGTFKKFQTEEWDFDITKFLKALTFIGFFIGLLGIISGAAGLILDVAPSGLYEANFGEGKHLFTSILLIILGIFTLMKPINDLPIASILGVLAASAVCIIIALLIPESAVELIENFVDPKIVLIIVFIIVFAIVALTIKFYTSAIMFLSKILSWPPFAIVVAIICFVQAFCLLVLGISIFF